MIHISPSFSKTKKITLENFCSYARLIYCYSIYTTLSTFLKRKKKKKRVSTHDAVDADTEDDDEDADDDADAVRLSSIVAILDYLLSSEIVLLSMLFQAFIVPCYCCC